MNTTTSLLALIVGLLLQGPVSAYEETSYTTKPDLFFARVGESTDISLPTEAEAAKLLAACKSGKLYRVESGAPTCRCAAKPLELPHTETLTVTLHCQATKGGRNNGELVLASESTLLFDEFPLDETQRLSPSSAKPILTFLKSIDPDLRKRRNIDSLPVYFVHANAQDYWLILTATITIDDTACSQRRFQILRKHTETLELVGEAFDIDSIVLLKPEGRMLLRSSNQCDGIQADLYDLNPKVNFRATFSEH